MKVTSKVKHLPVAFLRPMTAWVVHQTGYWTTREVGDVFYAPHKETAGRWRAITNHGGVSLRIQIDIGPLAEGQNPLSPEYLFPIVGALALSLRHARGRSPHGQMLG